MIQREGPFVVTGLGAVSAWGWGVVPLWRGLSSGETAVAPFDRFPAESQRTGLAAQVPPPPPELPGHLAAGPDLPWDALSWADRFALAATREALAGAPPLPPERTGVYFGGSTAGMFETEETVRVLLERLGSSGDPGATGLPPLEPLTTQTLDNPAAAVARMLDLAGPVITVSSACASGTQALGLALDALRSGEVDVALAGGADSLCRLTYSGFNALRVVDPEACRPFRQGRAGMSLGEGAAVLVIEPLDRVLARGAEPGGAGGPAPRATLRGVGNSCDAHHMTAPRPDGLGAALATRRALEDAGAAPEEVAFLNAHGTGTPLNDASEWQAFDQVFGPRAGSIPLTATKASVGHLLGSSGAIEAVATVLCLEAREVHPTPSSDDQETIDPETPARLVLGRPHPLGPLGPLGGGAQASLAVSTSFGFGGANAAAVLGPAPAAATAPEEAP